MSPLCDGDEEEGGAVMYELVQPKKIGFSISPNTRLLFGCGVENWLCLAKRKTLHGFPSPDPTTKRTKLLKLKVTNAPMN